MERMWIFTQVAVSVSLVDFLDPELAETPDPRERGVRVEVRPVESSMIGSIYASDPMTVDPAICRIDLLESSAGAADRMHWHPEMHGGEPGDRTFDQTMPQDPAGWLSTFLRDDLEDLLVRRGFSTAQLDLDLSAIRDASDEIAGVVSDVLVRARASWPDVEHDERGMAVVLV